MMALNRSPESFSPTNEFYIFVPLVPTGDPQGGASFDPKEHNINKIYKGLQGDATYQQERQIVARYARLTPSCKAGACTGQNSSMKNNKGH